MSHWNSPQFNFETSAGVVIRVSLELYASGTYDEPMLELDGAPLLEVLHCPSDTPDRIPAGPGLVGTRPNPEYRASEVQAKDLPPADQKRLAAAIERCIEDTEREYADDVSQYIAENAADALYEAWKDHRDHD